MDKTSLKKIDSLLEFLKTPKNKRGSREKQTVIANALLNKRMAYLFWVALMFTLISHQGMTQAVKEDNCVFSKEKWEADGKGKTGYRYVVLTAYECPVYEMLFSNVVDSTSIIARFGMPDSVDQRKNKGLVITYHVYQGKFLREKIHFHLNRYRKFEMVLYTKVGG